jgi:hypothetical protein
MARESKVITIDNDKTVYIYDMDPTLILGTLLYTIPKPANVGSGWTKALDINGSTVYISDMFHYTASHSTAGIIYVYNGQTYSESIEYNYSIGEYGRQFGSALSVYNNNLLIAKIDSLDLDYEFRFAMFKKISGSWTQQNDLDLNTFYSIPYWTVQYNYINVRRFNFYQTNSILIYDPNTIYISSSTLRHDDSSIYEMIKVDLDSNFNGNSSITNNALTVYNLDETDLPNLVPYYNLTYMNHQNAYYFNTTRILTSGALKINTISYIRNGVTSSITFPELVRSFPLGYTYVFINNYLVIVQKSGNQLYYVDMDPS